MKGRTSSIAAHLEGDWTINGVVRQIDPLMELSRNWDRTSTVIDIDCSGIAGIDLCGFQLLYTWLHCLDIRGVKPKLVNVPDFVHESQDRLGLTALFDSSDYC